MIRLLLLNLFVVDDVDVVARVVRASCWHRIPFHLPPIPRSRLPGGEVDSRLVDRIGFLPARRGETRS